MTGATLFSGIRAPEVARPDIDWQFCAEVEPFCCSLIGHRAPGLSNLGDVTAQDFIERARSYGPLDVLVAGSPCQAFSVAGLRKSLDDVRGNLTLRLVEIVHAIKPRYLLWENVPGVLSTSDNAFGCFLGGLVGHDAAIDAEINGWTNAGVVAGPIGTAAWRVLDAQYFGLAQRRKRVFLVFCAGNGNDPAEILFELDSMRRDFAPSREAGEGTTHDVASSLTSSGRSVERGGDSRGQDPVIAMSLNAKGGLGRIDAESETFIALSNRGIASDVAETVRAGCHGALPMVAHSLRGDGFDASEDGTGRGTPIVPWLPQGYRIQDPDGVAETISCNPAGGMRISPVIAPIAFSCKDHGADASDDVAPTLRAMPHNESHPNAGGQMAIAIPILEAGARTGKSTDDIRAGSGIGEDGDPMFTLQSGKQHAVTTLAIRGRGDSSELEYRQDGTANALLTPNGGRGGIGVGAIQQGYAVRRLTPRECERLQGFPDDYTLIPHCGKPAADGPRYKARGNSMAVPVLRWIMNRIEDRLR